jgi:hypothetical protein
MESLCSQRNSDIKIGGCVLGDMIKDTITYKNKTILTVYHQGFPQEPLRSKRSYTTHIEKNLLIFSEEAVSDDEWDNLTGYAWEVTKI